MTYRRKPRRTQSYATRRRLFEHLEPRHLLAAAPFGTNVLQPVDVTRDGIITPGDILEVINALAQERTTGNNAVTPSVPGDFSDVNADGFRTPQDILSVIEALAEKAPIIAAKLPVDSAPEGRADLGLDLLTNDYSIDLNVSAGELGDESIKIRIGSDGDFVDITDQFVDGAASLTKDRVDSVFGSPLPDGDHAFTVRIGDAGSEIDFVLSVDRAAPSSSPDLNGITLLGPQTVNVILSESIDESKVGLSTIDVVNLAGNDSSIQATSFSFENEGRSIQFQFSEPIAEGAYQIQLNQSHITDPGGNSLGTGIATQDFDIVDADAIWSNPNGGPWNRATNWESGQVPGPNAKVLIALNPGEIVTTTNEIDVEKVSLYGDLLIPRNTVLATNQIRVKTGTLSMQGRIIGAELSKIPRSAQDTSAAAVISLEDGTLDAVTLNAEARLVDKSIESSFQVEVENGLTVNDTLVLAGTSTRRASLTFRGEQTLDGSGQILFSVEGTDELGPAQNSLTFQGQQSGVPELLTIADGFTLSGTALIVGGVRTNQDYIDFQGRVVGTDGGLLRLTGLTGEIEVDDSFQSVRFIGLQTDLTINGSENTVVVFDDVLLDNVVLNVNAILQPIDRTVNFITVENGLTVNADLVLAGTSSFFAQLSFRHPQTVGGNGRILYSQQNVDGDTPAKNVFCYQVTESEGKDSLTIADGLVVPELEEC